MHFWFAGCCCGLAKQALEREREKEKERESERVRERHIYIYRERGKEEGKRGKTGQR